MPDGLAVCISSSFTRSSRLGGSWWLKSYRRDALCAAYKEKKDDDDVVIVMHGVARRDRGHLHQKGCRYMKSFETKPRSSHSCCRLDALVLVVMHEMQLVLARGLVVSPSP
jgi:hypothetical protein